jgi:hypothetical protein
MSKLTALKKQIAALEAQAERIAKEEMGSAIAKVKDIMAEVPVVFRLPTGRSYAAFGC